MGNCSRIADRGEAGAEIVEGDAATFGLELAERVERRGDGSRAVLLR
jgi:hypothetical protein